MVMHSDSLDREIMDQFAEMSPLELVRYGDDHPEQGDLVSAYFRDCSKERIKDILWALALYTGVRVG